MDQKVRYALEIAKVDTEAAINFMALTNITGDMNPGDPLTLQFIFHEAPQGHEYWWAVNHKMMALEEEEEAVMDPDLIRHQALSEMRVFAEPSFAQRFEIRAEVEEGKFAPFICRIDLQDGEIFMYDGIKLHTDHLPDVFTARKAD